MKKGKAAKKAAIAVVTAVAVGGVSVGGYYGIRQAQKTTVKCIRSVTLRVVTGETA